MTTPTTPAGRAPRKARKKVTTDLGRQLLTRERQRLSREQAALAEQQLLEAERRRTQQKRNTKSAKPLDIAVSRSLVKRLAGVIASEGISVRIVATPSKTTSAWTDFSQIVINYQQQDDDRILAANLRGLGFHEAGHCRFTLPFLDLAEAAGVSGNAATHLHRAWNCLEDQRMETAVTSDSPRKASYLTTMVMTDLVPTINHAASNWPLLIWRRYLPRNIRRGARKLFVLKANEMGHDGSKLASDLEKVTTRYVLATDAATMWAAVQDYHVLLQQVTLQANMDDAAAGHQRQYKRPERNLDDFLIIPVAGDMAGEDEGGDDEGEESDTIDTPEQFEHFLDLLFHVLNGGDLTPPIIHAVQGGKPEQGEGSGDSKNEGEPNTSSQSGDDDEGDEGDESDADDESEQGGDDAGKKFANEAPTEQSDKGGATGEHKNTGVRDDLDYKPEGDDDEAGAAGADDDDDDDELTEDLLQEAIDAAEAERNADPSLDGDVHALHEAINTRTSDLLPYVAGISNDVEAKAAADNLAQDIEQAFQENTVEKAPGWVEGERRGIVNVLRYATRRPGDVEFFRQYTETDAPGMNIAVSILLDYSGSMGGATKELAQVGYASKVACDRLDIPCTVTLWDTGATVLFDAAEQAEYLPVIVSAGGTDPTVAVADLDRQRFDKDVHIVIIMTDGAWSGACAERGFLASYMGDRPGRYFIGLGYNSGWGDSGPGMAENLRRYGCDEAHPVENLMEIPRYLEQALIGFA